MSVLIALILTIGFTIAIIISIVQDIKQWRRQAPNGKVFKKEFSEIINDIYRAQKFSKHTAMSCRDYGGRFKVEVNEYKPMGLEYSTIPMYMCYDIYINGEIVCREHIIKEGCKDKVWFEFSGKRERDEIITLVKSASEPAKEILNKNYKEVKESLGLIRTSFFEFSSTEEK